jgi:hypothetical protein
VAKAMGVELTADAATHLRWMSRELGDGDLRPYLPGAVCKILISICEFEGVPLRLDPQMIERIAHMYFTHAPERYGEEEDTGPVRSVLEDAPAPNLFGARTDAAPAPSMFGTGSTGDTDAARRSTSNWTDVAAKAVAALKAEDVPGDPDASDGPTGGLHDSIGLDEFGDDDESLSAAGSGEGQF